MSKTYKKCGVRFEDDKRFEIHKGVLAAFIEGINKSVSCILQS